MASELALQPRISVLVPVHNAARYLDRCLASVAQSTYDNYECIVVDDASTDESAEIAERHTCRVIRLSVNSGPAAARNRAATESDGEILFFIDSDVCVQPDSLERVARNFVEDQQLDAVIGSYDNEPGDSGFFSQYRNLFHHFIHQTGQECASTFWGACGAIRRHVLLKYGGFRGDHKRPAIEDIELGYRMKADGHKILLDKQLRVKHLKAWTFWRLVKTDIFDRGIPWTELILRHQSMPADLNLQTPQRINVILVHLLVLSMAALTFYVPGKFLLPVLLIALLMMSHYWFHSPRPGRGGPRRWAWLVTAAGTSIALTYAYDTTTLTPPFLVALGLNFVQHRFLLSRRSSPKKFASVGLGLATAALALYILSHIPPHPLTLLSAALFVLILAIDLKFYRFLARRHHIYFALGAIPFHLLYHLYNGYSFLIGAALHSFKKPAVKEEKTRHPAATVE